MFNNINMCINNIHMLSKVDALFLSFSFHTYFCTQRSPTRRYWCRINKHPSFKACW